MRLSKVFLLVVSVGVVIGLVTFRSVKAQSTQQPYVLQIMNAGTSSFQDSVAGDDGVADPELDAGVDLTDDGTGDTASATNGTVINRTVGQGTGQGPSVNGGKKPKSNPVLNQSFNGLNFRQQRLANHGNQFSVEPPDQGLCAGNGFVVEAVNDVLRVFDTAGNPALGVVDLNTFFGYAPAIVRSTGKVGPFVTDPSCYFDPDTQRWFVVVLTLDRVGTTPALAGTNHLDIAVSNTASPLGAFTIFRLPVQDDGTQGTPDHNCQMLVNGVLVHGPCLGDFPHIGADTNGFYITTNEFDLFKPGFFRASQIYAIPKLTLASGAASVPVFLFDTVGFPLDGNPGFTVWPATTPAMAYEGNAGGTEYFLSSVAVFNASQTDTRIRIWALSNTQSLSTAFPSLTLNSSVIGVNTYGRPPRADQMAGDIPLGTCINDTATVITSLGGFTGCWQAVTSPEPAHTEVESQHVDSGDSRMMQVVFANGKLWSALDTAVSVGGATKAGIAFYIINPSVTSASVSGSVVQQGVLALADNNLTYPAVGVTAAGRGVIAFTVIGTGGATNPGNFPSAGFAALDALVGAGPLQIAAAGLGPDDGFTSYKAFVGPRGRNRWGDYGAAVADGNTIWMASEYIAQTCTFSQYISAPFGSCGGTRASLGNWATRITQVTP
jgi:hypothetical protein